MHNPRPLSIFRPQMIIYKKTLMNLLVNKVFIKHIEILGKVMNIIKKKSKSEIIYSKKYLKVEE